MPTLSEAGANPHHYDQGKRSVSEPHVPINCGTRGAAGVNPVDWKFRSGYLRDIIPLEMPGIFGQEVSGVVEEIGPDAGDFSPGDEVFGRVSFGGYSEFALVLSDTAALEPNGVSYSDAATLTVAGATAYDGIVQLGLASSDSVLINGAGGGVGVMAVQLAKRSGATVIGTASGSKGDLLQSLGVVHVAYGDGVAQRIEEVVPDGLDAIYDLVGGEGLRAVGGLVKDPARLITAADPVTASEFGGKRLERANNGFVLVEVANLVQSQQLKPFVTEIFPFDEAAKALAHVEAGHAQGKIVVEL